MAYLYELYFISCVLNFLTSLALSGVFFANRTRHKYFLFFNLSILSWAFFCIFWLLSPDFEGAFFFSRLLFISAAFIPFMFLEFILEFIHFKKNFVFKAVSILNVFLVTFFSLLIYYTRLVVDGVHAISAFPFWPKAGVLFYFFLLYFFVNLISAFVILFKQYQRTKDLNTRDVLIIMGLGFSGGCTNYLLCMGYPVPPIGNFTICLFLNGLMGFVTFHRGLMDVKLLLSESIARVITMSMLLTAFFGFYFAMLNVSILQGSNFVKYIFLSLFIIFAFEMYAPIRIYIQGGIDKLILRNRLRFETVKSKVVHDFQRIYSLEELNSFLSHNICFFTGATEVHFFVLKEYIKEKHDKRYVDIFVKIESNDNQRFEFKKGNFLRELEEKGDEVFNLYKVGVFGELSRFKGRFLIPVYKESNIVAFILIASPPHIKFNFDDLLLFDYLAFEVGQVFSKLFFFQKINNALKDETQEKDKMYQELTVASHIQNRLLPQSLPSFENCKLDVVFTPSRLVSGDYYDFFRFSDTKVGIFMADIIGKGVPAAFLMAQLKHIVNLMMEDTDSTSKILLKLNKAIYDSYIIDKYVPVIFVIIDLEAKVLTYSNCGMEYGLLFQNDAFLNLEKGGLPLGFEEVNHIEEESVVINKGSDLFLFTDGVIETRNEEGEEFGFTRLKSILSKPNRSNKSLVKLVNEELLTFQGNSKQHDDITAISVEF